MTRPASTAPQHRPGAAPGTFVVETLIALRKARDLIDRHYAEPLDLDRIAQAAGYSRFHVARAFRAAYGRSPGQHLALRRIERAQELLRCTSLSVTEVCYGVGWSSLGSFSSRFTELTGTTPSQFRLEARRRALPVPACHLLMHDGPIYSASTRDVANTAHTEKPTTASPN